MLHPIYIESFRIYIAQRMQVLPSSEIGECQVSAISTFYHINEHGEELLVGWKIPGEDNNLFSKRFNSMVSNQIALHAINSA